MSRFESIKSPGSLEIRIKPENEDRFQTYFLGFWFVGWTYGWLAVFVTLISKSLSFVSLFMLVWLVFWTIVGLFAGLWLAWKAKGFEQITVDSNILKIKHNIFWLGPEKCYSMNNCHDLRAAGYFGKERNESIFHQIGMRGGVVAINNGEEVIRFGVALEEKEAKEIVDLIKPYMK